MRSTCSALRSRILRALTTGGSSSKSSPEGIKRAGDAGPLPPCPRLLEVSFHSQFSGRAAQAKSVIIITDTDTVMDIRN